MCWTFKSCKYWTAGHTVQQLDICWTNESCKYCTVGHLLDTLSSSWTPAGQPSPVNNGSWTLTPCGVLKIKKEGGHGVSAPWQAQHHIKSFSIVRKDIAPKGDKVACRFMGQAPFPHAARGF